MSFYSVMYNISRTIAHRDDRILRHVDSHSYTRGPDSGDTHYNVSSNSTTAYKKACMEITIPYQMLVVGDEIGQGIIM